MAKGGARCVPLVGSLRQAGEGVRYSRAPLGRVAGVGDHSQHHLDFWGRRQLSLLGQEPVSQSSGSVPTGPLCAGNPLL